MITPDIIADLKFYTTENGGRKGPTPSNFFGCVISIDQNNFDARLLLEQIGPIFPGECKRNVPIKFLSTDLALMKLKKKQQFFIRDGQVIGAGKVIKIVSR